MPETVVCKGSVHTRDVSSMYTLILGIIW